MRLSIVCDTYILSIIELSDELKIVIEKLNEKYEHITVPKTLVIALRCLPNEFNRKTFRRFDKNDSHLTLDISFSYEKYLKLYKIEKRHDLGHTIYNYLEESLIKYKFSEVNIDSFLLDFKEWCNEIGWILEDIDYSEDLEY